MEFQLNNIDKYILSLKKINDIKDELYVELDEILLEYCYSAENPEDFKSIEHLSFFKDTMLTIENRIKIKKEELEEKLNIENRD